MQPATQNFQVHLEGIINLLGNNLYSAPKVYIRELLQNAVDAITARRQLGGGPEGQIHIQVLDGERPSLVFEDNGIGLTEEEVSEFLASIGASTKREEGKGKAEYIGQFGIGLLSCFMVADEIVMITRSAKGGPALEWTGRFDGTYSARVLEGDYAPGTRVFLQAKAGSEDLMTAVRVEELVRHYGDFLPCPVFLSREDGIARQINAGNWPFELQEGGEAALLEYGRNLFGTQFMAAIPLRSSEGKTTGVAYVLSQNASLANKPEHRVYLKRMLLSESSWEILPNWAFFVQAIVNTQELRPTASREAIYQDDVLEKVRKQMGRCIRDFLVRLHRDNPVLLSLIIDLHRMPIKMLARDDDAFFRIIVRYLRFPTNFGELTLQEYRQYSKIVYHLPDEQAFEQVRQVAHHRQLAIINSRFDFDADLIRKLPGVFEGLTVQEVDPHFVMEQLEMPSEEEQTFFEALLQQAEAELRSYRCQAILRKFEPANLPVLLYMDADLDFSRRADRMDFGLPPLWKELFGAVAGGGRGRATLCLNTACPLIHQLAGLKKPEVLQPFIRLLYIQSLLLSNNQITAQELNLLSDGFSSLLQLQWSAQQGG